MKQPALIFVALISLLLMISIYLLIEQMRVIILVTLPAWLLALVIMTYILEKKLKEN